VSRLGGGSPSVTVEDYAALLRRRAVSLAGGVLAGLIVAVAYVVVTPPVYRATAEVLVLPLTTDLQDSPRGRKVNVDDAAQLVVSAEVTEAAAAALGRGSATLTEAIDVTVPANTSVLQISYFSTDPDEAARTAGAFATAYLAQRRQEAADVLQARRAAAEQARTGLVEEINAATGPTRELLRQRLREVDEELADAVSTAVLAGRVVRDADRPTTPQSPVPLPTLLSGAAAGLLLGLGVGLLRDRTDPRVLDPGRLATRTGLPVLADLPRSARRAHAELARLTDDVERDPAGRPGLRSWLFLDPAPSAHRPVADDLADVLAGRTCRVERLRLPGNPTSDHVGVTDEDVARGPVHDGRPTTYQDIRSALSAARAAGAVVLVDLPPDHALRPDPSRLFDVVAVTVDLGRTRRDELDRVLSRLRQDLPRTVGLIVRRPPRTASPGDLAFPGGRR
jgi:capsular polysaccharide biosynthesis protein